LRETWEVLLRQVGPAHHEAFAATDGEDPDWPRWYAEWLIERLDSEAGSVPDEAGLAALLEEAADAHAASGGIGDWPSFYAAYISERI
jgi:hypothetical protein